MHVLSLQELTGEQIMQLVKKAIDIKKHPENYYHACFRKGLLMLFQKTSTRTMLSFHSGIAQMGGYAVLMDWNNSNFSISPIQYEARYVSTNCDVIMARLKKHSDLQELAKYSLVPVINGCCEKFHPTQALADLMTIYEVAGTFQGVTLTYVGIHNNIANSLVQACIKVGMKLNLVTPIVNESSWDESLMKEAENSGLVTRTTDLAQAVCESNFIYTDTWIDMEYFNDPSYEQERNVRIKTMSKYQLNRQNLQGFTPCIMHDMPIHPGYEIEEELIEAPESIIYTQAENRMHAEKALLLHLLQAENSKVEGGPVHQVELTI
ncbi:ornithine carbamoyltransferase [Paenactinomyces guangxiensis]|nr:ornithine carbamoyltransferase [Paenactinomyces guangxiensis]